jgi:pimeloyl-ACP methyl ester carboxylesterase
MPQTSNTHNLITPTGRVVCYAIYGDPSLSRVIFYSHGFPASRLEASIAHVEALKNGVSIIALDRPGFGGSEKLPGRRFEDWADDVMLVANHHSLANFELLAVSGGTPSAIAAAVLLRERVSHLTIISGIGPVCNSSSLKGMNPVNRLLLTLGHYAPWLGGVAIGVLVSLWRVFPRLIALWFGLLLPRADFKVLLQREFRVIFMRNILEALSHGSAGPVAEFKLLASDWSYLLEKVSVPTTIWHGDSDTYVPLTMGRRVHSGIKGSELKVVPNAGHFMVVGMLDRVFRRE